MVRGILEFINVWTLQSLLSYAMNKLSNAVLHDMGQEWNGRKWSNNLRVSYVMRQYSRDVLAITAAGSSFQSTIEFIGSE